MIEVMTDSIADLLRAAAAYARLLERALEDNLVTVVLFDSVARGEPTTDSDIGISEVRVAFPFGRRQQDLKDRWPAIGAEPGGALCPVVWFDHVVATNGT
jgi:hypothetical protein